MIKKLFLIFMLLSTTTFSVALDKFYIDESELKSGQEAFYIHLGHNVWIPAQCMHKDETGLYAYESDLIRSGPDFQCSYQKTWKCPYCYRYWPIGTACQNKDCPSKYKISTKG